MYPVEVEEAERSGVFIHHEYGPESTASDDEDAPREFLEQHRRIDLDDDGYPEPVIVTVHKQSQKVVRIVPRFDPADILFMGVDKRIRKIRATQYYTQYDFLPNPEGGLPGVGLGQLLNPINARVSS